MTNELSITRRDFMNGVAMSLAAGTTLSPLELLEAAEQDAAGYYPPALTGMRGSHVGSFEVAHALAMDDTEFPRPAAQTDDTYDLVVVGGGISGLAAAKFWRDRAGEDASILVLDNHDDFGGHAKRNEFDVDGRTLIGYGGSQTIDNPARYSKVAQQLLKDVAIDVQRFYDFYDRKFYDKQGLGEAVYFDEATFGVDRVIASPWGDLLSEPDAAAMSEENVRRMPISKEGQDALISLLAGGVDHLEGRSRAAKLEIMWNMSYTDFLQEHAGASADLARVLRDLMLPIWGAGWDAVAAYYAAEWGLLGTWDLDLFDENEEYSEEPYIFHFPDGNAGVARSLVRDLVPEAIPGDTMEDLVTARADYSMLDREEARIRIRLNSTAVEVRHTPDEKNVDVTYVRDGETYRVRAGHAVLACYHSMIPSICPEVGAEQREALVHGTRCPMAIGNVAVRNWHAFDNFGHHSFYCPGDVHFKYLGLDFPVSMGDYRFSSDPDQPIIVQGWWVPAEPGKGLTSRQQFLAGRRRMYETSFDELESGLIAHLGGMLGGGFDAERDIAAITVNRWPHGYAYEYSDIGTPPEWGRDQGPHVTARARIGRISIANSDAEAYAYVNAAIDAADRAVDEQVRG